MPRSGPKEFQAFLVNHREGDVVTAEEILTAVPGWKKSSLDTYRKKHKLERFLSHLGSDRYRVMRDGVLVTEADINAALSQVAPPVLPLARGDVLNGENDTYELTQQLGRGAVGTVWKARARSSRSVAVKICNPRPDLVEPTILPNVQARFRHESRFGPRVQHDAIIRYLDVGDHINAPFLVMELAVESARDRLDRLGRLDLPEVVLIGQSVVAALRHLEANGFVHRDVKPPNILLTDRGYVLGDLGILRWGDLNREFTGAGTITKTTVQLGSWNYMSPEQVANAHAVTSATDLYALGVSLIELLTGNIPTAQMVAAGRVPPPCNETMLNDLIARTTRYDATERPSLDEVDEVLADIAKRHATTAAGT
jgi:serine/threonine protein kinase